MFETKQDKRITWFCCNRCCRIRFQLIIFILQQNDHEAAVLQMHLLTATPFTLGAIINSMFFKQPDFVAELIYRTTEEGGRQTPAHSGYRPQVKFPFSDLQTSGQQKFIGKDIVYPGETVRAEIGILSADYFNHQLLEGMSFEFREGTKVIGTGRILEILNKNLQKVSA